MEGEFDCQHSPPVPTGDGRNKLPGPSPASCPISQPRTTVMRQVPMKAGPGGDQVWAGAEHRC